MPSTAIVPYHFLQQVAVNISFSLNQNKLQVVSSFIVAPNVAIEAISIFDCNVFELRESF